MTKNLKSIILKSGIPLEASVIKKMAKFNLQDHGDYEYERDGKTFSNDCWFSQNYPISRSASVMVNYVIECKYKDRNQKWFFFKFNEYAHSYRNVGSNMLFSYFIEAPRGRKNRELFNPKLEYLLGSENLFGLPIADSGLDVTQSDSNPNVIREAVSQVSYASINIHRIGIGINSFMLNQKISNKKRIGVFPFSTLTIPIIVTTAPLSILRDEVTLEEIENSIDIMDLAEEVPGICLNRSQTHDQFTYMDKVNEADPVYLSTEVEDWLKNYQGLDKEAAHDIIRGSPVNRIHILNYASLEESLERVTGNIRSICGSAPLDPL
ncbi:MAG: hypothetical protein NT137_03675 [Methanomassiliicoccales archaeon]|nr:hypothetical protein [Methanomassiliicoccales archaeon]